jgi:N-hydroxyarylamine O-acetyltransferase
MMNKKHYFDRLQINQEAERSLPFLTHMQCQHVLCIPFENLDMLEGIPISLDTKDIFDKIIGLNRGGVCYELNGLFHVLLRELGFSVKMVAATVNHRGEWIKEDTHATNIVHLFGVNYLVDVGFGGNTPRKPIPLTGEIVQDTDGDYRVRPFKEESEKWILEKREEKDWLILYKFSTEKKILHDFHEACEFIQSSDESPFNKVPFLMKVTEQGRMVLYDNSLTVVENRKKSKSLVEQEDRINIYRDLFDMSYQINKRKQDYL